VTNLTRSITGAFDNASLQQAEMASKCAGRSVCDHVSTASRISS